MSFSSYLTMITVWLFTFLLCSSVIYAQQAPQIQIVSPANNVTILGGDISVSFIVGNLIYGKDGHVHLWLDATDPVQSTATELASHQEYTLSGLPPGRHAITLEVVKPDHTSFSPRIATTSVFIITHPSDTSSSREESSLFKQYLHAYHREVFIAGIALIAITGGILVFKKIAV